MVARMSKRKVKLQKDLNADALFSRVRAGFETIIDPRTGDIKIPLADALMSGFAMFSLKDSSLLAFEGRQSRDTNLKTVYKIGTAAIPIMAVNAYKRRLVHLPFRKHFMILRASARHVLRQINNERRYNSIQLV